ncbi:MAG: hypothetical protein CMJ83_21125 [Planctomycetes bacterium]|nr:hypothetical protein [Planctomycetota bacterium]
MRLFVILCVLAVSPLIAQTTGLPFMNDFSVNGQGAGTVSNCNANITVQDSITVDISALPGAGVIGALSQSCSPGSLPIGLGTTTIDIDISTSQIWIDATNLLATGNPLNNFATANAAGAWSFSINAALPVGLLGWFQCAVVGAAYPGGVEMTQAHQVTNISVQCTAQPSTGPTGDDTTVNVVFQSAPFTFYGTTHNDVWINSNGNLTFTAGDTDFTSTQLEFLNDPEPRIAPCWDDFSPNAGGSVTYNENVATGQFDVSWINVPHFAAAVGDANSFCASLNLVTGEISLGWDTMGLNGGTSVDQIVGISPGSGLSLANNVDLSLPFAALSVNDAIYEDFSQVAFGAFDLAVNTRLFQPTGGPGAGPYQVF